MVPLLTHTDPLSKPFDSLFDDAEIEDTPEATSRLLHAVLKAQVKTSFHKINVHAAMTPTEIKALLSPIVEQAEVLQDTYQKVVERKNRSSSIGPAALRKVSAVSKHSILSTEASVEGSCAATAATRTPFVTVCKLM